jgi:Protein of unknown function (DUF3617)
MRRNLGGAFLAACLASLIGTAGAAGNDELWEVSTQMNMAGLPAGMGARTSQVCTEKGDPKKAMTQGNDKCKVTDLKQTGNSVHMAMSCPEGDMVVDTTYNAARTEYKGTMKMTSKQGDMTMNMQGRKIGTCDATAARAQQNAQVEKYKAQGAAVTASIQQENERQVAQCKQAADNMQIQGLGMYARCDEAGGYCEQMAKSPQMAGQAKACMASAQDYCRKYQTRDGFLKASRDADQAAKLCKVSNAQLKTAFCAQAQKAEDLPFLANQCPVEAKPLAQAHCTGYGYTAAGMSFTAKGGTKDKWASFCQQYLSHATLDPAPASSAPSSSSSIAKDPAKAAGEAVNQGINKLKGLFGR